MHVNKTLREIKAHGTKRLPLEVYEDDCRVYYAIYAHWHKEHEIIFIQSGKGSLWVEEKEYPLQQNDIIVIAKEQIHYIESDKQDILVFKSIVFDQSLIFDKNEASNLLVDEHVIHENQILHTEIKNEILNVIQNFKAKQTYHDLMVKSHLLKLVYLLLENQYMSVTFKLEKSSDIVMEEMIAYIHDNFTSEIKSEQLAQMAGYSKFHFTKIFKDYTGKTVVDFIHQLRMNHSLELLKKDIAISQVAMESGYDNVSYFIKRFKLMTGKSPIQYKKDVLSNTKL